MPKLIVLDRDGVINQDSDDYIKSPDEFIPIPGSLEAMARLTRAGWRIAVALSPEPFPAGVDTEADLARVERVMRDG